MKIKQKKKIIICFCVLFVFLLSCVSCDKSDNDYNSDEYTTFGIPEVFSIQICFDSEGATDIFVNENYSSEDSETWELKPEYGAKYEISETGGVIYFTANEEQCNNMLEVTKKSLENAKKRLMEGGEIDDVEWNDDYSSLTIYVSKDKVKSSYLYDYARLETMCYAARFFYAEDKDAAIKCTFKNTDTGHVITNFTVPYERMTILDEDWEESKTEDVTIPFEYTDNISFSGTLDSMSNPYIYFIPDDPSIFDEYVTGDDSIEKVVISYDDVFIGYKCKQGDRFNVRIEPPKVSDYESGTMNVTATFFAPEDAKIEE